MIGQQMKLNYPEAFTTLPEYTAHNGQTVLVVRQLTEDEADQGEDLEKMYEVVAEDGFVGHVFESELDAA